MEEYEKAAQKCTDLYNRGLITETQYYAYLEYLGSEIIKAFA